jgi:asparagine synthase (glutamine-hydrolysing)
MPRKYKDKNTEKFLLRKAFINYLPEEVLWRPKEAFSDGVSSLKKSWFSIIQELAELKYTDEEFLLRTSNINHCKPRSKESLMYREYFEKFFSKNVINVIPYYWLPKWSGNIYEPSARVLDVYKNKLNK